MAATGVHFSFLVGDAKMNLVNEYGITVKGTHTQIIYAHKLYRYPFIDFELMFLCPVGK